MKRQLMTGLFAALAFTAVAQSNEWRDPEVNAVNRAPMLERSLEILLGKER